MIPPGSSSITPRSSTFLSSPMALVLGAPSRGYKDTCGPIQASSLGSSVTAFSSPQSTCSILPERLSPRELGDGLPLLFTELPRGGSTRKLKNEKVPKRKVFDTHYSASQKGSFFGGR